MLPFQRVLVTGGTGFVGRVLVPALQRRLGPDARLFVGARTRPETGPGGEPLALDMREDASVRAAVEAAAPDLVVHLAAQSSVGQSFGSAGDTWQVNVGGSLALARAVASVAPGATVLFASSAEVYGATFKDGVAREESPLRPQTAYSRSKAAAEAMLADVLPAECRLLVVRPSNHTGPGQDERFVVPSFAAQVARVEAGQASEIRVGNLDAERDFLDVRDVVEGYVALLGAAGSLPARSTFNLSSNGLVPISGILSRLRALSTAECPVTVDPLRLRPSDIPAASLDSSPLRALTGWHPRCELSATLGAVLDHWRGRVRRGAPAGTA